ncbi:uncharacterized protein LOC119990910 isoform X2 [Tripterygium wilfordii]|nr:uncharacterized protein LOC119990910 isoform X2 [Tripterygium wilfordii]
MATSSAASNSNAGEATSDVNIQNALKRASGDIGWEFGELVDASALDKIKCKLCSKVMSGGIYRLKCHVAGRSGNVRACHKASKEAIKACVEALDVKNKKKTEKQIEESELRNEVSISGGATEMDEDMEVTGSKRRIDHGPMGRFVETNSQANTDSTKFTKQASLVALMDKKKVIDTQQYIARWAIENGIAFNAIQSDSFKLMTEAIGQFGPGLPTPSRYRLSGPCLKAEVARVKNSLKKHEDEWGISGCSIMTDAWTDRKRRSIMNLCVHCREMISFISSREDSDASHTGTYIFDYVDKCIEDVGQEKVVQVVTDNASNNMAAASLMEKKRPNLFWTSCAAHTVNLMLEAIGKLPRFKSAIDKARALTIFIYAHHSTLSMMRKMTKKRDIVRPGVTRFATNYLCLQSLVEKKEQLRHMFTSEEWARNSHSKSAKGKLAYATVVSISFWKSVNSCLLVFHPLVKVLRLVDSDRPSMPWLYGELQAAIREIKEDVCSGLEKNYKPILDIIDSKSKGRLDSSLHLVGYLLNPYYFAKNRVNIGDDATIMEAFLDCVEKFFPDDLTTQGIVSDDELIKYKKLEGMFGRKQAIFSYESKGVNEFNPAGWWSNYGGSTPNLKKMAIRILSLTTSSSGCERNWSTFEGVHTKKRNRLDSERLNNLVYVQFNAKLLYKKQRVSNDKDVLQADDCTKAQHWLVDGVDDESDVDPVTGATWEVLDQAVGADEMLQPRRSTRNIREIDEEEFVSEESSEEDDGYDFESDEERDVPLVEEQDDIFENDD